MRNRLFVVLTTVALATSSLPIGVYADTDVDPVVTETVDTEPTATPIPTGNAEASTADADVILSGDCSATDKDHVEWKVVKNNETGKLKLVISGKGKMGVEYTDGKAVRPWIQDITRELNKISGFKKEVIREIEVCKGVKEICMYAFYWADEVERVILPSGLTKIEDGAFEHCESLKKITIPEGITSIEHNVFFGCSSLEEIVIPEGVTSIWGCAFAYCSSLEEIVIPESVTFIGQEAFSNCDSLKEMHIPESVTSIRPNAFLDCTSLKKVHIPEGVTSIGLSAFSGCSGLKEIFIPDSVSSIGESAFSGCSGLVGIIIPDSVSSIGYRAFANCSSLKEITIPGSVTDIPSYAFRNCSGLKKIRVLEGVKRIHVSAWKDCSALKSIRLPKSLGELATFESDSWTKYRLNSNTPLSDVYYNGSKEEWDKVKKPVAFYDEEEVTIHYQGEEIVSPTATPVPTATATPAPTAAVSEISGQISGTALSLKGKLGANVLLGFADAKTVEDADPSVVITVDDKETVLKLSEQEHYTSGKKEIYEISTFVPARQINDEIELKLIDKNGKAVDLRYGKKTKSTYTFSIGDIADSYLKNPKQYDTKTVDLVKAIKNYGGYAQLLTGYKADEAEITDKLTKITAKDLKPYEVVSDKGSKIAKYTGIGLSLQSDTNMQVYFKLMDKVDAYTFTVDGENVTPEDCGEDLYCVNLNSIPAGKLSTASEIVISRGDETFTIKASALGWAETVLSNSKGQKQEAIDMAKMLYRYAQKVDAYFSKA